MKEISKTADRALDILVELRDGEPATPQQLSRRISANRTVVQRLLMTLLARGFVVKTGGEYALAPRMSRLADAVAPRLRAASQRSLLALGRKVSETVVLQIVDGDDIVVLVEAVPTSEIALQVRHGVGSRSSMLRSASGLAILPFLPASMKARILDGAGPGIHDRVSEIERVKFAISSSELQDGVSGIAVPVFGPEGVEASIAVLVPAPREGDLTRYLPDLKRQAKRIESLMV
ncbi:helix-turn-helix domain-containing protein [Microbacterium sp. A8/3-1]|uniref:Helix-turn-helix domain-containing protein n=1 Tax=Microbacterium sp. A8/3-1 TaxID=3160749 RepID=A0AAU7VXV9_9MICO